MENPPKKFFRLSPGKEVRLRYAYFITCREVVKNAAGEVVELRCTYDPATRGGNAPDGRKVQATLHWVGAADAVPAEIRLYNQLFARPEPERRRLCRRSQSGFARGADAAHGSSPPWPATNSGEPSSSSGRATSAATRLDAGPARLQPHGWPARHLGQGAGRENSVGRIHEHAPVGFNRSAASSGSCFDAIRSPSCRAGSARSMRGWPRGRLRELLPAPDRSCPPSSTACRTTASSACASSSTMPGTWRRAPIFRSSSTPTPASAMRSTCIITVQEMHPLRRRGMQIEDQEAPKKSGTAPGGAASRSPRRSARSAPRLRRANELDPDFVICARCDVTRRRRRSFEDALERCIAYVKDGGADFVWLNSVETREQVRQGLRGDSGAGAGHLGRHSDAPPTLSRNTKSSACASRSIRPSPRRRACRPRGRC